MRWQLDAFAMANEFQIIRVQILSAKGQKRDASCRIKDVKTIENIGDRLALAPPVAETEVERVEGIEPS
jgi:hypothetical protein